MNIARVFPRATNATPTDEYAFHGPLREVPGMFLPPIDEVRISVAFTYDLPKAERLAKEWEHVAPVKIGGPALNEPGGEFIPGMYLQPGYVITSRGCPNRCAHCSVWRREGQTVRELPITQGNILLDDNLLACSDEHIRGVFEMMKRQPYGKPEFTGGLEAAILKDWHVEELRKLNPKSLFFAYDTPDDLEPLREAGKKLLAGGFPANNHSLRCYVLIGKGKDTFEKAEERLWQAIDAGFFPMAMLWKNKSGDVPPKWAAFQRAWANPWILGATIKKGRNPH